VTTSASVERLNVQNRLTIEHLELQTRADDPDGKSLVTFGVPEMPKFAEVKIDGKPMVLDLDPQVLRFPNKTAIDREWECNPEFRREYQDRFYTPEDTKPGQTIPPVYGFIVTSFVRDFSFPEGMPERARKVNGNTLELDNFGTISFGEYFLGDRKRIVTLIRLQMGSDWGGDATFCCGISNPVGDTMP